MFKILIYLARVFKSKLSFLQQYLTFVYRVVVKGGYASYPLSLANVKNVIIGRDFHIKKFYRIECYEKFYNQKLFPELIIGDGVHIENFFTALVADKIVIGSDTIFADKVSLISENHGMNPMSDVPYHAQKLNTGPISIGKGCWFGEGVIVLPGVTIGDKCIIAAHSVVTRDIPAKSIAAGSPAVVIKIYDEKLNKWVKVKK